MEDHKIIKLIEESDYLPQIPKSVGGIFNMLLNTEEFEIDDFVEKVSEHPQLENMIIKYLNSSTFDLSREIESIKDAIIYLGINNIKGILISFITRLLLPDKRGRSIVFNNDKYWKHCIGTSIASYMISEETGLADKDKMFTYGLIHDIGVTVLDICLPDLLDKTYKMQKDGVQQIVAEKIVLGGKTHADIGMWLCDKWKLPIGVKESVGYHHTPFLAKSNITEVKILHLADEVSTNYYQKLLGNHRTFIYSQRIIDSLGISNELIDDIIDKLPEEVEKSQSLIDFQKIFHLDTE